MPADETLIGLLDMCLRTDRVLDPIVEEDRLSQVILEYIDGNLSPCLTDIYTVTRHYVAYKEVTFTTIDEEQNRRLVEHLRSQKMTGLYRKNPAVIIALALDRETEPEVTADLVREQGDYPRVLFWIV